MPEHPFAELKPVALSRAPEAVKVSVFLLQTEDIEVSPVLVMRFGTERTILDLVDIGCLDIIQLLRMKELVNWHFRF